MRGPAARRSQGRDVVKRLLALFLLVNVVGVVANLPRIIQALDGAGLSDAVSRWVVGVSTATGDLLDEANEDPLTPEDVARIQEELRTDALEDPLDDESVAALVELWRVLEEAGAQLQADDLRELLIEEGIDPATAPTEPTADDSSGTAARTPLEPTPPPDPGVLLDERLFDDEESRSALDALRDGDG